MKPTPGSRLAITSATCRNHIAASVLGRHNISAALIVITIFAAILVIYSLTQLAAARRAPRTAAELQSAATV